jgi:hypothetical protein
MTVLLRSERDALLAKIAEVKKAELGFQAGSCSWPQRILDRNRYLRLKSFLRVVQTMLADKAVCVRRLREGSEVFKSMAQQRADLRPGFQYK